MVDESLAFNELVASGLDNIDQGISVFDKDLKLVFANRRLADLLDIPDHLLKRGVHLAELLEYNCVRGEYGPGDPQKQLAERLAAVRQNTEHTIERTRPNGQVIRISGTPLAGGGFASIYTDITKDRAYELKLEMLIDQKTADLRRSEERLRLIADEVPAGIVYLDQDEIFRFVNRRFARAYNKTSDEIIGKKSQLVLSKEAYSAARHYFAQAKLGKSSDFDMRMRLSDGRKLDVRTFLRPDIDGHGVVNGFYVLSINVTSHKDAALAFTQAQKMEAIGRLSSGIAHDFNNLLTVILGNLKPLAEQASEDKEDLELIMPAFRAARKGADLTKQLLTVARRQSLEPRPVDVSATVRSISSLARSSLPDNIALDETGCQPDIWAFVDPGQLENALLNLLLNARDAIDGEGAIDISLDYKDVAPADGLDLIKQVRIVVADNGSGIPPEIQKKIYDPFFSTKTNEDGSGLGLTMTQSFVEQSRGSIDVWSRNGKGTRFTILLPVADKPEVSDVAAIQQPSEMGRSGLVLVVDDNMDVRKVVRRELMAIGYTVLEAGSAQEALHLLEQVEDIYAVVSDISMPGQLSGIDLVKKIHGQFPAIITVLMTGHGANEERYQETGLSCPILRKPFSAERLADALTEKQEPERELENSERGSL